MEFTFQQLKDSIKKKDYRPVYFLHGSEPYFIDYLSDLLEETVLSESEKVFNQIILYGKDVNAQAVVDQAQRYPMMAPWQVVILREAQDMRDIKELEHYVKKPVPTTILVVCHKHKAFDMRTSFGKSLGEQTAVFKSDKIRDYQLEEWISEYAKAEKLKMAPTSVSLLAEYLGADISVVVQELEKVALHLKTGEEITPAHIEKYIGISREYNFFELQKALAYRDEKKSARIIQYLRNSSKTGTMILLVSSLASFFMKVYSIHFLRKASDSETMSALGLRNSYALREYRQAALNFPLAKTEEIISILHEYDLKTKGVGYNTTGKEEKELISEMMWRIMH